MTETRTEQPFVFMFDGETLGQLFMPNAGQFEVLQASAVQEEYIVDSLEVVSQTGRCRLIYAEWEEDNPLGRGKWWTSEYAIELAVGEQIAYGVYRLSFPPEQGDVGVMLDRLRLDAEEDFMLCCKLIGRLARRDLVVEDEPPTRQKSRGKLH